MLKVLMQGAHNGDSAAEAPRRTVQGLQLYTGGAAQSRISSTCCGAATRIWQVLGWGASVLDDLMMQRFQKPRSHRWTETRRLWLWRWVRLRLWRWLRHRLPLRRRLPLGCRGDSKA